MRSEDMADMDQNPSRNCLSLSAGMKPSGGCLRAGKKPSGGCFSDEKQSVQSWRLVVMGWEDMAHQSVLPKKFRLSFSTGAMKHPPDGFIPVLRDRQFSWRFVIHIGHIFPSIDHKPPRLHRMFLIALHILRPSQFKFKFLLGQLPL